MPSQRETNNRDPLPQRFTFQQGKWTFKHTRGNGRGGDVHNDQNTYKAQWDPEEGVTNYLQSGQRELPEEVICKLILMDESEDHFEMTKKTSCTTVKSVHGEYFWVWKLEESFNSIEQAYAQSLLLPWVLCWVSVNVMEKKKKVITPPAMTYSLNWGKKFTYMK